MEIASIIVLFEKDAVAVISSVLVEGWFEGMGCKGYPVMSDSVMPWYVMPLIRPVSPAVALMRIPSVADGQLTVYS